MIKNDSYNWTKGAEPIYADVYTHLGSVLGNEYMERYADIFPVLSLIFHDINTRYITTGRFDAIFSYDEEAGTGGIAAAVAVLRRILLKKYKKEAAKLPAKKAVMLSSTFAHNPRYTATLAEIRKIRDITHILSFCDVRPLVNRSGIKPNKMQYNVRPVVLDGSVSGKEVKKCVRDTAAFIAKLVCDKENCTQHKEESEKLFNALQKAYTKRIKELENILSQHQIERYITINQFNLRDVMIMDVCHRLGIPTRQMEHHASWCMHPAHRPVPIYRYAYADSYGCWSDSDLKFHQNFYEYQPVFGQKVELYTIGNPETNYEKATAEYSKYEAKNQIVYMVSGIMDENDEKLFGDNFAMQQRIFAQLKKLGEKTGWDVLVRFPPAINPKMMAKCTPILEEMGIKVSPSIAGTLMEDMCTSRVVFGTISSVLSTAVIMGRKVYRITAEGFDALYTEEKITSVAINDIGTIADDWCAYPLELKKEQFIDYNLLVKD